MAIQLNDAGELRGGIFMQVDDVSKLLLEAVLCKDEQQKEAIFQKAFQLEVERLANQQNQYDPPNESHST